MYGSDKKTMEIMRVAEMNENPKTDELSVAKEDRKSST